MVFAHAHPQRGSRFQVQPGAANLALFSQDTSDWTLEPRLAFDHWLVAQRVRASSARVYRAIWGQYLSWLKIHRISVPEADAEHIAEFLRSLGSRVKRPQRERYHRLLERVYEAIVRGNDTNASGADSDVIVVRRTAPVNPASLAATPDLDAWRAASRNEPTYFLCQSMRRSLIEHLNQMDRVLPFGDMHEAQLISRRGGPTRAWRALRNRALYAVLLGAGLKLHQATALELKDIDIKQERADYWLTVQAADSRYSHRTRLEHDFARWFGAWLHVRRICLNAATSEKINRVFLTSTTGEPMSKSAVQRALVATLDLGSWTTPTHLSQLEIQTWWPEGFDRKCPQVDAQGLRNSCAATWFEESESVALVAERLGYADMISASRLYTAWQARAGSEGKPG